MKQITEETKFSTNDRISIPITHLPNFRSHIAIQDGVSHNMLFRTWGGLGDQICAEPTLRYALKAFQNCEVSLSSECPELFGHLKFAKVFDERIEKPRREKFLVFDTITPPDDSNLVWQFFSHMLTNCVDFPSLCALRSQLPVEDREIYLSSVRPHEDIMKHGLIIKNAVFVHAGRHWPSKTFPKAWWDETLKEIRERGMHPVLIGADTDDNRGTVDVDVTGCLDFRNKLSVRETIWLLQRAKVLLTNDSSPMHMAASVDPTDKDKTGYCHVKVIATCKHPDYLFHFRKKQWAFREENLGLGGMWDIVSMNPNQDQKVTVDEVDEKILKTWLPAPASVAMNIKDTCDRFWS